MQKLFSLLWLWEYIFFHFVIVIVKHFYSLWWWWQVAEFAPSLRWGLFVQVIRRNAKHHLVLADIPNVVRFVCLLLHCTISWLIAWCAVSTKWNLGCWDKRAWRLASPLSSRIWCARTQCRNRWKTKSRVQRAGVRGEPTCASNCCWNFNYICFFCLVEPSARRPSSPASMFEIVFFLFF